MLQCIVSHQSLSIRILSFDLLGKQIVNICTLHAQCLEHLSSFEESTPSMFCKWYTNICFPKIISNLVEVDFLDYLEAECLVTFLALLFKVAIDYVCHHELKT